MPGADEPEVGLDLITSPQDSPPVVADAETREAIDDQAAGFIEACQLLAAKPALHRTVLSERESARLTQIDRDCRDMADRIRSLTGKYTKLASDYSRLRQTYESLRANLGLAAAFMAAGGVSVSWAGAISDPFWKPMLLWGGIAGFAYGLFAAACNLIFVRDRRGPETPEAID